MARIRTASYDVQREQILAQAAMLFAQRGYASTSMNEVAQACQVSKPALYHYVRDKNELLASICEEHLARLKAVILEVQEQGLEAEASIRRMILRFVEEYADAQDEHRVLTEDVKYLSAEDRARVLEGERFIVHAVAAALARLRPDLDVAGLVKPLTMLLFGMINWMFTWLKPGRPVSHAAMAPIVADLFFGGLGAVLARPGGAAAPAREAPGRCEVPHASDAAQRADAAGLPKRSTQRKRLGVDR